MGRKLDSRGPLHDVKMLYVREEFRVDQFGCVWPYNHDKGVVVNV